MGDASIYAKDINLCIDSQINGLTIEVNGTNQLNSIDAASVAFSGLTHITGYGTLNLKSQKNCGIFIYTTELIIQDCIVNAKGRWGITGYEDTTSKLTIRNTTVTAEGKLDGSITDLTSLIMEDCSITQPTGAKFDPSMQCVALNGEVVKSKVVITTPTAIETPTADAATVTQGIYTLSGVRLSGELKDLPKGIYIVNGKKVVKP